MRLYARLLIVALGLFVLVGCENLLVPAGEAPLRYRDLIFDEVVTTEDIEYGQAVDQSGENVTLELDVYEPAGDDVSERPLIVFVHGGGFAAGTRTSPEIVDEATHFARQGYVTASISYRLSEDGCSAGAPTASCVTAILHARQDAQAAIEHLRDQAAVHRIDTGRVAIAGTSAGAITALEVAFSSTDDPDSAVGAGVSLSGAHILTNPEPGDGAALLFHGTDDGVVPYAWAENTRDVANDNGARAVLTTWEDTGHVAYLQNREQILRETRNFLHFHLELEEAAR